MEECWPGEGEYKMVVVEKERGKLFCLTRAAVVMVVVVGYWIAGIGELDIFYGYLWKIIFCLMRKKESITRHRSG